MRYCRALNGEVLKSIGPCDSPVDIFCINNRLLQALERCVRAFNLSGSAAKVDSISLCIAHGEKALGHFHNRVARWRPWKDALEREAPALAGRAQESRVVHGWRCPGMIHHDWCIPAWLERWGSKPARRMPPPTMARNEQASRWRRGRCSEPPGESSRKASGFGMRTTGVSLRMCSQP